MEVAMKIGVADYGLNVWYGALYDFGKRMDDLKTLGFDGVERLSTSSAWEVLEKSSELKIRGMDFSTIRANNIETSILWTAAMGKKYVWADQSPYVKDFDAYCRTTNYLSEACAKYGIICAVHNHLGSLVETQEQLEEFMQRCPNAGLIFDLGHMAVAGGNIVQVAEKFYDRIVALHLKDWTQTDPNAINWWDRGFFCGLEQGDLGVDNESVVKYMVGRGYDKWIFIEHDTHKRDPLLDLNDSMKILKKWLL